MMVIQEMHRAH